MPAKRRGKPVLVALVVVAVVRSVLAAPGLFRLYDWMLDVSWPQVESTVTVDEKPVNATVHRSPDGRYVRIDYDTRLFVVDVEEKIIGSPSRTAHKLFMGRFLPQAGFMGVEVSADNAKSEHDPHLVVRQGVVSFVDYEDRRVSVTFPPD